MILLVKLLLAHFLGDFLFQTEKSVKNKEERKIWSPQLYLHIAIHSILLIILLGSAPAFWQIFFIVIIAHYAIDLGKLYLQKENTRRPAFFIDQILHLAVVGLTAEWYQPYFKQLDISGRQILLLLLALTLLTVVSALIIRVVISVWSPQTDDSNDESLARAGYFIGILERLFVFAFIVTNHWEAVGFLLAAKSVFRFGDLKESKDRKLTEYILIGTLISFGLAILIGIFYTRFSLLFH